MENIHEYLATIGSNVRSGKIKLDEFIIYKVINSCTITYRTAQIYSGWEKIQKTILMQKASPMSK